MGIEKGSATSQAASVAAQRPAAGKAAAQAAAGGDFLALMAAIEDGAGVLQGDVLAPPPGSGKPAGRRGRGDAPDASGTDPAAAGAAALLPVAADGTGVPVPLPAGAAASAGGAAGVETVEARPAAQAAPSAARTAMPAAAPAVASPTAQDAAVAGSGAPTEPGPSQSVAAPATSGGASPPAPTQPAGPPAATMSAGDPRLAPQYASVFEQLQHHLAAGSPGSPGAPQAARTAPAPAGAAAALRAQRDAPQAERGTTALSAAPGRGEVQAAPAAQDLAAAGQAAARSGGQDGAGAGAGEHGGAHAGWAAPDFTPTVQYDAALAGLDGAAQAEGALDQQLADQLRQWASQGVRSAELTVGTSDPVQVRIALDGNEAQVQFRAEHAATRELLAGSVDQLRQLLGAEGLALSGVTVGGHGADRGRGQGDEGAAERAAGARRAVAGVDAAGEAVGAVAAAVPRQGAGRLDLYV